MNEPISFRVPAIPVAQPRPRAVRTRDGSARIHEVTSIKNHETGERKPHPIAAFKATTRLAAEQAYGGPPLEGPLRVILVCVFQSKKKLRCYKSTKPDCDNLAKSTLDALNGLLFKDDGQVVTLIVEKWHAAADEQPHVDVRIEPVTIP